MSGSCPRKRNIGFDEAECVVTGEVCEIRTRTRREIVYPDHAIPIGEEPVDEMRPEKVAAPVTNTS
jgi:hypothetical protein